MRSAHQDKRASIRAVEAAPFMRDEMKICWPQQKIALCPADVLPPQPQTKLVEQKSCWLHAMEDACRWSRLRVCE